MKFRKKPVVVDAINWDGENDTIIREFLIEADWWADRGGTVTPILRIRTLEGVMAAIPGDWIIQGMKGEFYPCKPDIFEATYEAVEE